MSWGSGAWVASTVLHLSPHFPSYWGRRVLGWLAHSLSKTNLGLSSPTLKMREMGYVVCKLYDCDSPSILKQSSSFTSQVLTSESANILFIFSIPNILVNPFTSPSLKNIP